MKRFRQGPRRYSNPYSGYISSEDYLRNCSRSDSVGDSHTGSLLESASMEVGWSRTAISEMDTLPDSVSLSNERVAENGGHHPVIYFDCFSYLGSQK